MKHQIADLLYSLGQSQLISSIQEFSPEELDMFWAQIKKYDPQVAKLQRGLLLSSVPIADYSPWNEFAESGNDQDRFRGEALIKQGKVGCLILAGGQGTRFGYAGPKGAVPVTAIKGKSCFQLFSEKCKAAGLWAGKKLPLCIMTSPSNHAQTIQVFQSNNYFGLDAEQVSFFQQGILPFMDDTGNWLLEKKGKILEGPDGNGHALHLFFQTGIGEQWKKAGIEYLNVIFVDNPLADPFDPEFVGFTERSKVDAALKAIKRLNVDEKMGVVAEFRGKLKVIEYSEIPCTASLFNLSSTGMFCIRMDFIEYLCKEIAPEFPLHLARKMAKVFDGSAEHPIQIWKCERFLFDLLDYVRGSAVLVCPREKIYAPLKNASGDKSLETVRQALLLHDKQQYLALTGKVAPVDEFELDPAFYYPSKTLSQSLKEFTLLNKTYVKPQDNACG